MEQISFSVALIRKMHDHGMRWLARMNGANQLGFVIGQRLEQESFRESAIREVAWDLGLDRTRDFLVSNSAQMNLEFVDQIPGQFSKSLVRVSFYNVEIYRQDVKDSLDSSRRSFWVTSEEICKGLTIGGRKFDPLIPYLVQRSNVIQYWESSPEN